MDRETRNAIERATQRARKLLQEDFAAQLEGAFDVHRDGVVAVKAGGHLSPRQAFQRESILAAIEHKRAAGMNSANSVADYLRDAAFTTLNRFVALKMLEARELVQECVTKGEQSAGYREFCGMAPGIPLLPESAGYRLYLESLFDELSTEVKILFDRRDPSSVLWPKRATFEQLLEGLNAGELAQVWGEDETIGWVYQFFNGQDERKKMRDESQVPRNSRELAVRNQFFTPRYVVQFLTDNTLGRIWYETRGTHTALADRCQYMVRKPVEEFAPRTKKDPRDLRVLDPACGSGHFLLYAYDLLLAIYEEAYDDPESPKSESTGRTLAEDYPDVHALRKAVPGLIMAHNLHGVDIDPRCAQIAQLALWMRAQKAYRDFGIGRAERARIRRSNIVVAEPLADDRIAKEFVAKLGDAELGRVFTALVESLNLAGDLGLLLRVETLVDSQAMRGNTGDLFAPPEERIRAELDRFVREETGATNTRRRLFADDAAHAVALLGLAEKKFDVILMNPPFGDATARTSTYLKDMYPEASNDIFAAFIVRGIAMCSEQGLLGAITSRTGFFAHALKAWRRSVYERGLYLLADLGEGVMDAAMVEAAAYCIGAKRDGWVFRHLLESEKEKPLLEEVSAFRSDQRTHGAFPLRVSQLLKLQDAPLAYWLSQSVIEKLTRHPPFEPSVGAVRKGLRTGDNFRFVRAHWELSAARIQVDGAAHDTASGWVPLVMTGASQPWFSPVYLFLNWHDGGRELRAFVLKYGTESRLIQAKEFYFAPGFSWTLRAARLYPYAIPPGCVFTGSRPMAFPSNSEDAPVVVSLFASRTLSAFLRLYGEQFARPKFLEGKLKLAPMPELKAKAKEILAEAFRHGSASSQLAYRAYEPFLEFVAPRHSLSDGQNGALTFDRRAVLEVEAEALVREAFGLTSEEVRELEMDLEQALELADTGRAAESNIDEGDGDNDAIVLEDSPRERAWRLLSYAFGCVVGRWDIRRMIEADGVTEVASYRVRSLPAGALDVRDVNHEYPIRIVAGGLVQDDIGAPDDLTDLVEECLRVTGTNPEALLTAIGGVASGLRVVFRRDFFQKHIGMYTLGRRKAPIYWQLATPSTSYSVWLYIHAFSKDTLFRVQNDYAAPKLAHEERRLESLINELRDRSTAAQRRELAAQQAVVEELRVFLEEVKRVAPLWRPNLDDGVVINSAPLWRLVPQNRSWQKELKSTWDALCDGKYEWAHLAMHLWPERVVPKCAKDRSLAITHGLENEFWVEGDDGKWTARTTPTCNVDDLVRERTSPAVKSALKSLLDAHALTGNGGRGRGGRRRATAAAEGGAA